MEDFKDIKLNYQDFCGYYIDTGNLCPLIIEDLKQNDEHIYYHPHNFNVNICLYLCDWFRKINIPEKIEINNEMDNNKK